MSRKSATVELEAEAPVSNGHTPGYRPVAATRKAVADAERFPRLAAADGAEPFWAEIRDDLTFTDTDRIPFTDGTTFAQQWDVIAPWVVAWNATAYNPETNAWEPVPPPAEAGPDAFKTQTKHVTSFLVLCLKFNADLNLPKGRKPSGATDAG